MGRVGDGEGNSEGVHGGEVSREAWMGRWKRGAERERDGRRKERERKRKERETYERRRSTERKCVRISEAEGGGLGREGREGNEDRERGGEKEEEEGNG